TGVQTCALPISLRGVLSKADALVDRISVREETADKSGVDDGHLGALVAVVGIGERTALEKGDAHGTKVAGRDLSKVHYRDRFPYHDGAPFDIQPAPIPAVGTSERHGHGGTSGLHSRRSEERR